MDDEASERLGVFLNFILNILILSPLSLFRVKLKNQKPIRYRIGFGSQKLKTRRGF